MKEEFDYNVQALSIVQDHNSHMGGVNKVNMLQ
jgi:hypothetical protein